MKTLLTIKAAIAFFMLGCATLFAGCSKDDGIASWQTMKNRLDAMSKLGIGHYQSW